MAYYNRIAKTQKMLVITDLLGTNTKTIMAYPIESILKDGCPIIPLMSQILDNALVSLPYVALTYAKVLSHLCSTY